MGPKLACWGIIARPAHHPATEHTQRRRADLALLFVTLLWGLTFPLIRSAVQDLDPFVFLPARFGLATVLFLPLLALLPQLREGLREAVVPGLVLGVVAWSSYLAQTIGLQSVPAGRAGFITGTCVVLVPLMSPLFRAGRPSRVDLVAAAAATFGLYLLTAPSTDGGLTSGDLWIVACAVGYAAYIHLLKIMLTRGARPGALAFTQVASIALCGVLALPWVEVAASRWTSAAWTGVVFCALFATVVSFLLQTRYQADTTPERAALIFAMEPVFAAGFAFVLLAETMAALSWAGASVILVAIVGAELAASVITSDEQASRRRLRDD